MAVVKDMFQVARQNSSGTMLFPKSQNIVKYKKQITSNPLVCKSRKVQVDEKCERNNKNKTGGREYLVILEIQLWTIIH